MEDVPAADKRGPLRVMGMKGVLGSRKHLGGRK